MIKKFIIGIGIFGIFIIYSLGIRHQSPVIGKPSSLAANTTPVTTTTTSGSGSDNGTSNVPATTATTASGQYKDATYSGSSADAYYGNVRVSATISGGKITNIKFLDYPHTHSTSVAINQQAMPYLVQEAIKSQSANVQIISGATFTSQAFAQSLSSALTQAKS